MRGLKTKRSAGLVTCWSLGGHREEESSLIEERRRESPGPSVEGEAKDGGGRVTARQDGGEGGACECGKRRRRVVEIRTVRVGRRENEWEVKCFAKICSSTSRLEQCLDELWGGTNATTKLTFPVCFFTNKLILRARQPRN